VSVNSSHTTWQNLSRMIALLARARMAELNVTQQQLAEQIDCTQQNVSAILSGKTNLTLDTIARLEDALQFSLIRDALESRMDKQ
jgi:transcriptional regulator with XRE-family HTH domain